MINRPSIYSSFNKGNVKLWMRNNYSEHVDDTTGEVNLTSICEAAADYFEEDNEGGPLDDPDHWIWECPIELFKNKKFTGL